MSSLELQLLCCVKQEVWPEPLSCGPAVRLELHGLRLQKEPRWREPELAMPLELRCEGLLLEIEFEMVLLIEKGKMGLRAGPGRRGVNRRKRRKKMLPRKGGRKGGHDRGYHAAPPPPEIHAHAQRQSGLREKDKNKETGNRGTGYCFRCGRPGHHSRECPCLQEKKKDKSRSRDRDRDRDKDKEKKNEDRDRSRDRGKIGRASCRERV